MRLIHPARRRRLLRMPLASPRLWRRRAGLWAGAVLVSLAAIAFAAAADRASAAFAALNGERPMLALLIAPAGLMLAVLLTRKVFPGAQGSGIPQVIASMHMEEAARAGEVLSPRIAAGKVLLTLLGLLCGASIGREGPTVQVGASIMHRLGTLLRLPTARTQHAFILAGGAAGVAAAFNTPLAGIVFAIEELAHGFESRTSGVVLTAVVLGGIVTLALTGNYTYFGVTSAQLPLGAGWIAVPLCAACGGLLGGLFAQALVAAAGLSGAAARVLARRPLAFAAACGLALALLGLASGGATYGTGYAQARALVEGRDGIPAGYFVMKLAATVVSYVSGIPGGIFAPSLSIGAGLGQALSHLLPQAPPAALVLLGMAAYFAGVVQAPITATVIVMEMTDNQAMTIPLMATSFLAFGASRLVCRRPLYRALAKRFLLASHRPAEARDG
jgi:H+/Cl- antiporter ClcA